MLSFIASMHEYSAKLVEEGRLREANAIERAILHALVEY
jgi:hypothetical protein